MLEDDDVMRSMLREVLIGDGYDVVAVRDGAQALPLIHLRPDLVMLDLRMPTMDGRAFLRRLREDVGSGVPVLIVTGDLGAISPEMAGAKVLAKPFAAERLLFEVASLVAASARPRASAPPL